MYNKYILCTEEKTQNEKALDNFIDLLDKRDGADLIDRLDIETLLNESITIKDDKSKIKSKPKKKSDKFPLPNSNINLEAFLAMTTREIKKLNTRTTMRHNMSTQEQKAIETLINQHHLTMKPPDKGAILSL